MLADRKNVAVRIQEPTHFVTRGSRPNAQIAILDERIFSTDTPLPLSQLTTAALESGCSTSALISLFREDFGATPKRYLQIEKIQNKETPEAIFSKSATRGLLERGLG